jgi:16S rRNA processing protein RimM
MMQIAQVLKSNGTDGELVMSFREIAPEDINLKEPVFIVFDGLPVPFFIESLVKRGHSKALVHLTGIRCQEDVDEIAGKAVYIEDDNAPELTLEEDGFAALVGWMVLTPETPDQVGCDEEDKDGCDEDGQDVIAGLTGNLYEVGEITDFIDIPNNPCIEVETENGAVMLPLHQDLILSVDPENQEIIMQIPAGLL